LIYKDKNRKIILEEIKREEERIKADKARLEKLGGFE
jgi:hypothetical protein